jgi:hypothetical protein
MVGREMRRSPLTRARTLRVSRGVIPFAVVSVLVACSSGIGASDLRREVDAITIPSDLTLSEETASESQDLTNRPFIRRVYEARQLNAGRVNLDRWLEALLGQGFTGRASGTNAILRRSELIANLSCPEAPEVRTCSVTYTS